MSSWEARGILSGGRQHIVLLKAHALVAIAEELPTRLWGLSLRRSERLLSVLVDGGFLVCDKTTVYRRRP